MKKPMSNAKLEGLIAHHKSMKQHNTVQALEELLERRIQEQICYPIKDLTLDIKPQRFTAYKKANRADVDRMIHEAVDIKPNEHRHCWHQIEMSSRREPGKDFILTDYYCCMCGETRTERMTRLESVEIEKIIGRLQVSPKDHTSLAFIGQLIEAAKHGKYKGPKGE